MIRRPFDTLLAASRGEIAVRVLRAARELGLRTVAVHSEADADARHVVEADFAVPIGPAPAIESYLRIEGIIAAARATGVGAIHPGYGFLSENPALAEACEQAGLAFVGPPAEAIRRMGDKTEARRLAVAVGVPVVSGYDGAEQDEPRLLAEAARIGSGSRLSTR
jgi:3-methylcrotonyl-CoA carboxylase alpha subunit